MDVGRGTYFYHVVAYVAKSSSNLSSQTCQDVFFWESIFHSRTLLQATLALSLVVSSLKSVCSDFSIFSAVMPRSPACPLFNLVRNSVVQSPSSVIRDPRYGNVSTCSRLSVCAVGAGAVGCVHGVGSVYRRVNVSVFVTRFSHDWFCFSELVHCRYSDYSRQVRLALGGCIRCLLFGDILSAKLYSVARMCRPIVGGQTRLNATNECEVLAIEWRRNGVVLLYESCFWSTGWWRRADYRLNRDINCWRYSWLFFSHLLLSAVLRSHAVARLLLGARRPPLSIDISCPHGAQQQTRRTPRTDDGRSTDS